MKRLIWGTVLFLCMAAGDGSRLLACDDRPMSRLHTSVFESGDNTVMITSDEEFVTVIVYSNSEMHTEWM
jgi:hypothetical protein